MTNRPAHPNDIGGDKRSFLTRLKEYKEFIAILVFFVGGLMWIYGYFATKEQVKVLQCLTNKNIALVEGRMQTKIYMDDLCQKRLELEKILDKDKPSTEEEMRKHRLKSEIEILDENLKKAQARYNEALNFLKENKCQNLD